MALLPPVAARMLMRAAGPSAASRGREANQPGPLFVATGHGELMQMSRAIACVLLLGGILFAQKGPHNAIMAPSRPSAASRPTPTIPDSISPKPALLQFVQPQYPDYAKQLRIEGTVVLEVSVDKDGAISSVKALSGPPLLIRPAVDAVKKWRYKPFEVDGRRVGMQTLVAINFQLSGRERRK